LVAIDKQNDQRGRAVDPVAAIVAVATVAAAVFAGIQASKAKRSAEEAEESAKSARQQVSLMLREDERETQRRREERMPQLTCTYVSGQNRSIRVTHTGPDPLASLSLTMRTSDDSPLPIRFTESPTEQMNLGDVPVGRELSISVERAGEGGATILLDFVALPADGPIAEPVTITRSIKVDPQSRIVSPHDIAGDGWMGHRPPGLFGR
jgi:hypothetical protein